MVGYHQREKLFYVGKWNEDLFKDCVAVVGSRKMTDYGRRVIEKLVPALVRQGRTIVSGFMYGTDQYAHQACVDNGGKTIAVLGWGIDKKLSGYDQKLAEQIVASGGLMISEWETQEGTNWTFPVRNKLVVALCNEVYITEAAQASGSLITARLATKAKKKVWAVPGPITSKTSVGTNNLIAAGLAQAWLGLPAQQQILKTNDPILNILDNEALSADELARKLNRPVAEVGADLSILLLSGVIIERGGKYYLAGE